MRVMYLALTTILFICAFPALGDPAQWHSVQQTPPIRWMYSNAQDEAILNVGDKLVSADGALTLLMQNDGNLVLYRTSCLAPNSCRLPTKHIWDCLNGKPAQPAGLYYANLQWDGNLVVYKGTPGSKTSAAYICDTGKFDHGNSNGEYFLWVNNDEIGSPGLVIYKGTPGNNKGCHWDNAGWCGTVRQPPNNYTDSLCGTNSRMGCDNGPTGTGPWQCSCR